MTVKNPNALVSLGSTAGGGELVVEIADRLGYSISTGWGIAVAGAISYVVLFVGREGIRGLFRRVWSGAS